MFISFCIKWSFFRKTQTGIMDSKVSMAPMIPIATTGSTVRTAPMALMA
jgi:hypothetical protein